MYPEYYIVHNGEKYENAHRRDITFDEYDEVYFVTKDNDETIYRNVQRDIYIGGYCCGIKIAYHYALLNKTFKIIDDEIFIPIRKFIGDKNYFASLDGDDEIEICFWNCGWISLPENANQIVLYILIYKNGINDTIDILHDNVKKHDFGDYVTLMIAEINGADLHNLNQKIARYCTSYYNEIFIFHHVIIEKN